jgi:hypothetical protein
VSQSNPALREGPLRTWIGVVVGGEGDAGDCEGPPGDGDVVTGVHAEREGECALDHHASGAQPAALSQLRVVNRVRRRVASLHNGLNGEPVCLDHGEGDGIGAAVSDDPRQTQQRGQIA